MERYTLHFDGSCAPRNPGGFGGFGYVLRKSSQTSPVDSGFGVFGQGPEITNNLAEFYALSQGLRGFLTACGLPAAAPQCLLNVYGDSRLVILMMNRRFTPTATARYYGAYLSCLEALKAIRRNHHTVMFDFIRRTQNTECDVLSKAHFLVPDPPNGQT